MNFKQLAGLALLSALLTVGCASHYIRQNDGQVDFYLRCPQGHEVALATSLDGFIPHKAHRTGSGLWAVTVAADRDFSYFYLVDENVFKPDCRMVERDDFGGTNCIFSIAP